MLSGYSPLPSSPTSRQRRPAVRRHSSRYDPMASSMMQKSSDTRSLPHQRANLPSISAHLSSSHVNPDASGLVDIATAIIKSAWPESSVSTQSSRLIPLHQFIEVSLRRSHSTFAVFQLALLYLFRVKGRLDSHISDLPSQLQCGRRIFVGCLILANKYLQDRNYSNKAWSKIVGLPKSEVNQLEISMLQLLDWKLFVGVDIFLRWSRMLMMQSRLLRSHRLHQSIFESPVQTALPPPSLLPSPTSSPSQSPSCTVSFISDGGERVSMPSPASSVSSAMSSNWSAQSRALCTPQLPDAFTPKYPSPLTQESTFFPKTHRIVPQYSLPTSSALNF
ncbi:uncharacterized protein VTP21DRAFT_8473 [Calcarisporiella thermophila]|uniref:uncharacterized protein n=1 Tax=Calcarisporiella thermophila TaxID=911321 RepID=UPI00374350AD